MYLLTICMSSSEKKIYIYPSLLPIFSWITWYFFLLFSFLFFFFLLLSCMSPSFILEIYPLSNIWFKNTFSLFLFTFSHHFIDCLFTLLMVSFAVQSLLVWHSPTCWFLLLLPSLLLSYPPKKSCKSISIHRWHEV